MESKAKHRHMRRPRQLPIVHLRGVDYFVDIQMNRFMEVDNPYNFIDFDTEIGKQMWSEYHVIECPNCGIDEGVWEHESGDRKVCSWCGCSFIVRGRQLCLV